MSRCELLELVVLMELVSVGPSTPRLRKVLEPSSLLGLCRSTCTAGWGNASGFPQETWPLSPWRVTLVSAVCEEEVKETQKEKEKGGEMGYIRRKNEERQKTEKGTEK